MVPKSVLNQLRREAVEKLIAERLTNRRDPIRPQDISAALEELREFARELRPMQSEYATAAPQLYVLVRTQEQLEAIANWRPAAPSRPALVYCDFEDVRRYGEAVALAHAADQPIGLATLRIIKPGEEGLLADGASRGRRGVGPQSGGAGLFSRSRAAHALDRRFFAERRPTN